MSEDFRKRSSVFKQPASKEPRLNNFEDVSDSDHHTESDIEEDHDANSSKTDMVHIIKDFIWANFV